jgi:hypothetical protein
MCASTGTRTPNVAQLGLLNAPYDRVATNQPRTIGVDLSYRF